MATIRKNVLLTGHPGSGKSTLVRKVVASLAQDGATRVGGFYTLETRRHGQRTGFAIHTLDGQTGRLAEVGLRSRYRVGRYGVDISQFEAVALTALDAAIRHHQLVVIDEIGLMELKSKYFQELVREALDAASPVLATIMSRPLPFTDAIKRRADVQLIEVRGDNRDAMVATLAAALRRLLQRPAQAHSDPARRR